VSRELAFEWLSKGSMVTSAPQEESAVLLRKSKCSHHLAGSYKHIGGLHANATRTMECGGRNGGGWV
jgi:hypothetical protein